jgi:cytochrome c oxidase cbb3-type subunit IV
MSNTQSVLTVVMFVVFLGIVAWAWSGARKKAFAAAAQLPFVEEDVANNNMET